MKDAKLTIVRLSKADVIATSGGGNYVLSGWHNNTQGDLTLMHDGNLYADHSTINDSSWTFYLDQSYAYGCHLAGDDSTYDYSSAGWGMMIKSGDWNGVYSRSGNIFTWISSN